MFIMCGRHFTMSIAAITCVVVVSSVSGFAQSNSGYSAVFAIDRTSPPVMREYVSHDDGAPMLPSLPSNVTIPKMYQPVIATMLERSPTFRRQCRRIAHVANLAITLQATGLSAIGRVRARTRIERKNGTITAAIEVLKMEDPVELIAHELEHIIEQLDGVDLASKAVVSTSGVQTSSIDWHTFETTRARRVGLAVATEVGRGSP